MQRRKLGEQERLFHYIHRFGALIAVQVLHVQGAVTPKLLQEGLAWLQDRHPTLRAHIEYREPVFRNRPPYIYQQPYFAMNGTRRIPLRVVVDPSPDAWRRVFEEELRRPLRRGNYPRMRAVLVRASDDATTCEIFLTSDHAIADAQSTNMASRDLLGFVAGLPPEPLVVSGLPAALESALPEPPAGPETYLPAERMPLGRPAPGRNAMRTVRRCLPPDAAQHLREAIRLQRTTLHGAVSAAFLSALRQRFGLASMTQLSTVDLRRMCRPPVSAQTFGCFIDLIRTRHALSDDFWAVARDVSFKVISSLAKDRSNASLMKLPGLDTYRKELWPVLTGGRRLDALAVTTAGESGLARNYGELALRDVTMAVSTSFLGPALFVIASEWDGQLDLHIGYPSQVMSAEEAEAIGDQALGCLERAGRLEQPA